MSSPLSISGRSCTFFCRVFANALSWTLKQVKQTHCIHTVLPERLTSLKLGCIRHAGDPGGTQENRPLCRAKETESSAKSPQVRGDPGLCLSLEWKVPCWCFICLYDDLWVVVGGGHQGHVWLEQSHSLTLAPQVLSPGKGADPGRRDLPPCDWAVMPQGSWPAPSLITFPRGSSGILLPEVKVKSLSCVQLSATTLTVAYKAPLSTEFSRQDYWSGLPFPSPGDLPVPGKTQLIEVPPGHLT